MSFAFGFSGDDIEEDTSTTAAATITTTTTTTTTTASPPAPTASAFPVQGKPQLPPTPHALGALLATLPSKIAYDTLDVTLDGGGGVVRLPRRELWDVRVQLMAEDDGTGDTVGTEDGLGDSDVKTGVYEGGFKSWESSVDLVKVLLAAGPTGGTARGRRVIEVGYTSL
jgi:protein-histidine N-methyltransferase